jgi:hypothetical protein
METLYYFAIGGTGALTVEPLLHLCAAGLGPRQLTVVLVDPDSANPAVERAIELIELYRKVRDAFGRPDAGFFRTEVSPSRQEEVLWSPIGRENAGAQGGNTTLGAYVDDTRMAETLRRAGLLFDLLYSQRQQEERLREGFRGNPAIGSILMTGLKDAKLIQNLKQAAAGDNEKSFFAVGSIFGGTGAAGLPVLATLLQPARIAGETDAAWQERSASFRARLGAAVITPYFSLPQPTGAESAERRLRPDSSVFLRNTRAALPTYVRDRTAYGSLYVVGDSLSLPHLRRVYSAGGEEQRNDPYVVELYAALAALDFARNRPEHRESTGFYFTRVSGRTPGWPDLPLAEPERAELQAFLVGTNLFLQYFGPTRDDAAKQLLMRELAALPWLGQIGLSPAFVREDSAALDLLGAYFAAVWGYLFAVQNAPTGQQTRLDLVRFTTPSDRRIPTPVQFPFSTEEPTFALPRIDATLSSFGASGALGDRVEAFRWFNRVRDRDPRGLPGFLHYLRSASRLYVGTATRGVS